MSEALEEVNDAAANSDAANGAAAAPDAENGAPSNQSNTNGDDKAANSNETDAATSQPSIMNGHAATSAAPSNDVLARAHLLRADALKKNHRYHARFEARKSIELCPNLMPGYALLSDIEKEDLIIGKAEVTLLLGLKFDAGNEDLTRKLHELRDEYDTELFPQLPNDDSIRTSRYKQRQQRAKMSIFGNSPPVVARLLAGEYQSLDEFWDPGMSHFQYGDTLYPVMHFPIIGYQSRRNSRKDVGDYKKVIDFVFERGARLDAKDQMGYTALFHAADSTSTLALLDHLLKKGADPNVQSVLGTTALYDAAMAQNERAVDTLLTYGANAKIVDNSGNTPYASSIVFKSVYAVFEKHLHAKIPAKICAVCGEKGSKRCVTCRVVFYCGGECQKADWPAHKKKCKKLVKGHKRLKVARNDGMGVVSTFRNLNEALASSGQGRRQTKSVMVDTVEADRLYQLYSQEYNKKGNLLLKIQAGYDHQSKTVNTESPILAYNEDNSFRCFLDQTALDAPELIRILVERGSRGYFWAFMERGKNEVIVITDPRIPAQPW